MKQTYFHISDEPSASTSSNIAARAMVEDLLEGFVILTLFPSISFTKWVLLQKFPLQTTLNRSCKTKCRIYGLITAVPESSVEIVI